MPQSYLWAIEKCGGVPLLIPATNLESTLRTLYRYIDGLLLAGGGDIDPAHFGETPHSALGSVDAMRDWAELIIASWALADGCPVFGICRGIQTINVAAGGSVWQDLAAQVPESIQHKNYPPRADNRLSHAVYPESDSHLAAILGDLALDVNSLHHQAVKDLGAGLRVGARSPDGVIEAIEGYGKSWVMGVQWHPEWLLDDDPRMLRLLEAFVSACGEYRDARNPEP